MEPVKMKAPMPQVNSQSASHEDADESAATEHEFREILNSESANTDFEATSENGSEDGSEDLVETVKPAGRRRRRAASSGIITA
jgi:ribonuclease E